MRILAGIALLMATSGQVVATESPRVRCFINQPDLSQMRCNDLPQRVEFTVPDGSIFIFRHTFRKKEYPAEAKLGGWLSCRIIDGEIRDCYLD